MFTAVLAIAAGSPGLSHSILDALPHLAGMLVVMVSLAVLWGICALTAKLVAMAGIGAAEDRVDAAPAQPPQSAPHPESDDSDEILAVIAAAVVSVVGRPCRIVSVKPISTSWERAGRQAVLTSHRIR